ncbi:MAG TPA: gamma-glutamyl-gamma-aminobutyrate hydrolase family protein, partial [Candidatus Acidoferrum sp.]
ANVRMLGSMTPESLHRPRIGIPWRTSQEEAERKRGKVQNYEDAVERAGGEPVLLPLTDSRSLERALDDLQGFLLPGSPADVDPKEYGRVNQGKSEPADGPRERTDRMILDHAFREKKPVLAICYGCQLLNVYQGGTLVQDLRSETGTKVAHRRSDLVPEPQDDPQHEVQFEGGSKLAALAGGADAKINSSHHQSIEKPGNALKITGVAKDGIVESVEWTGDSNWVVGVQWHPERMAGDPLAEKLFADFVSAAQAARRLPAAKS